MAESLASPPAPLGYLAFSVAKAIQAVGVVLRRDGVRSMNAMRLLKLLYLADREALRQTGRPIVGGAIVAVERGPLLREVHDLVRGRHRHMPLWDEFLRTSHFNVELLKDPDVGLLSRFEIQTLQDVARHYADDDEWDLSRLTRTLPEWQKNNPGTGERAIALADVLEAVGRGAELHDILEEAAEKSAVEDLLGK
jgi:uncharacterized phage-associated protein